MTDTRIKPISILSQAVHPAQIRLAAWNALDHYLYTEAGHLRDMFLQAKDEVYHDSRTICKMVLLQIPLSSYVGCAVLWSVGDVHNGLIASVFVKPEWRLQGMATRMLSSLLDGITNEVNLIVNDPSWCDFFNKITYTLDSPDRNFKLLIEKDYHNAV